MEEATLFESLATPNQFVDVFDAETKDMTIRILGPTGDRIVHLGGEGDESQRSLAPFHTLEDVARALWIAMDSFEYYPEYVFLGEIVSKEGEPLAIQPLMGHWYSAETEDVKDTILLPDPRTVVSSPTRLETFVTSEGERQQVRFPSRGRMTLEDVFLKPHGRIPSLVAISFASLLSMYPGNKQSIPPADFYGKFYPYFPALGPESPYSFPMEMAASVALERVSCELKLSQTAFLNFLAEEAFQQGYPTGFKVTGYRYLTFQWKDDLRKGALGWEGADTLFYSAPANERRPFMRFLSPSTTPMTKLFQPNPLEPPFVNDPTLLRQWIQERSPTDTDNLLFIKLLFRQAATGLFPLFGTVRIYDTDGSADVTFLPPKGVRLLTFQQDTPPQMIAERLQEGLSDTPYQVRDLQLARGTIHLAFTLPSGEEAVSKELLRGRIAKISTMLQEIPPPPDENPFLSLRYKAVSNFVREDTISMYLTMLDNRDKGKDRDYIGAVANEFGLSREDAEAKALAWRNEAVKVSVVDSETRDYKVDANPGTDIVIYAQATTYTCHIYRLESLEDFRRIYTLLYLLFFLSDTQWDDEEEPLTPPEVVAQAEASAIPLRTVEPKPAVLERTQLPEGLSDSPASSIDSYESLDFGGEETPEEKEDINKRVEEFRQAVSGEDDRKEEEEQREIVREEAKEAAAESKVEEPPPPPVIPAPIASSAAPIKTAAKTAAKASAKPVKKGDTGQLVAAGYFIKRLKELDPALFTQKNPKGQAYTSQCQANWDRQPAVLSKEQYENVKRIYRDDERLAILTLGEPNMGFATLAEMRAAQTKPKKIWMMRFGSDTMHLNYYVCAEFFCMKDMLPIHRDDWKAEIDVEDNPKPKNSCPVCHGLAITNRDKVTKGETVIARKAEPNGVQAYIGFLGKSHHPAGFHLPCCFTSEKKILWEDDKFGHLRRALEAVKPVGKPAAPLESRAKPLASAAPAASQAPPLASVTPLESAAPAAPAAPVESQAAPLAPSVKMLPPPKGKDLGTSRTCHEIEVQLTVDNVIRYFSTTYKSYDGLRITLSNENIVDFEKYPLRPGVVGLCPPGLDAYFAQESTTLVHRPKILQVIKPTSMGFFRVGVLNESPFLRRQSFFAALAPYLHKNNVQEVMEHICASITPRIFLQLNFGNLLLEFYKPEDPLPLSKQELQGWCSRMIGTGLVKSEFEMMRLYKSYKRFVEYIFDPQQIKQARHFFQALAEGFLTPKGLTLIPLEYTIDPRVDAYKTQVHVKCPLLGYNLERYKENDVGFITYMPEGIWEPLLYVSRPNPKGNMPMRQEASFVLTYDQVFSKASPIVSQRLIEFATQCRSQVRGAYTVQRGVDTRALIPLSRALDELRPSGVVRDIYNHVFAVTMDTSILHVADVEDEESVPHTGFSVLIPVSDDGVLIPSSVQIHLTIDSVSLAPIEDVLQMYDGSVLYQLTELLESRVTRGRGAAKTTVSVLNGFVVSNRTKTLRVLLPCGDKRGPLRTTIPIRQVPLSFQTEYKINREIYMTTTETDVRDENPFLMKRQYAEDLYQHFRLMFSNWLQRHATAKELLNEILTDEFLPSFEKRYRIQLLYVPEMLRWIRKDTEDFDPPDDILLRKDCISIEDPGRCTGYCSWKQDEDRCLLHTPDELEVRYIDEGAHALRLREGTAQLPKSIDAGRLLTTRLVDELVRLPAKRYELMMKQVSRIQVPTRDIHQGDQWYLPENTPAWDELLRGSSKLQEQPMFWEEFSRETEGAAEQQIPAALKQFVKPAGYTQLVLERFADMEDVDTPVQGLLRSFPVEFKDDPEPEDFFPGSVPTTSLSDIQLRRVSAVLKQPVVQIQFAGETPIVTGFTLSPKKTYVDSVVLYLPDIVEGGAILRDTGTDSYVVSTGLLTPALFTQIRVPPPAVLRRKTGR